MQHTITLWLIVCVGLLSLGHAQAAPDCAAGCSYLPMLIADDPPTIAVVGNPFSYTDSISYLHIIGEVRNAIGHPVELVRVTANIFDSQGRFVATNHAYARLDPLPTNTTTCFDVAMQAPADVGSIRFEQPTYYPTNVQMPRLSITNDSGAYNLGTQAYSIIGMVTNDDTIRAAFVNVSATLYNAGGQAIGCDVTYVSSTGLDPGQSSSFDIATYGRDYSDVARYKLQAQGEP